MVIQYRRFLPGLGLLLLVLLALGAATAQAATADQVQTYKKAVANLDAAEKKLATKDLAGAKTLLKEANRLFARLQQELPDKMSDLKLTSQQEAQWLQNNKLGEDSSAQGEKLMRSGQAKLEQGEALDQQGQADLATKLQQEAKRELDLATQAHLKAQIYHLRNMQLAFSFLGQ
ncbi:MAG: hypothetical protein ACUVRZ_11950 [Desulfobacca sp.]|uniref:hypothetical protein n=1 Tax=Desulfobacca sp. TaxID=2067990 RepID=UPI0040495647